MTSKEILTKLGACPNAIAWIGDMTPAEGWERCERGDWMLWFAVMIGVDRKIVVRTTCACGRQSLQYVPAGEDQPRITIETTEKWCDGNATLEEVIAAADAVVEAAAWAADAVALAALAAEAAGTAGAALAAGAAEAAALAAGAVEAAWAAGAAEAASLKSSADIVRHMIPVEMILDQLEKYCHD